MTLKVGDKVRLLERNYMGEGVVGETYTVSERLGYCVHLAGLGGSFVPARYEKIEEPTPKFRAGDRAIDSLDGGEVVVEGYRTSGPFEGYVRARYADGGIGLWKESELTKIEQSVPFFLRNGDLVVNRKTGRKGEVIRGMVYDVNDTSRPTCKGVPAAAIEEYEDHHPGTYDLIKKDAPW